MAKEIVKEEQHDVAPDSVRKGRLLIRYDKSFSARVIQGESELRSYYDELKGELLSYKGVKSRISWKHESFRIGKVLVALLKIRGKHISIYLPLNANDYVDTKYKVDDVSNVKANAETPCAYAIKNDRRCLYAKDLIATVMSAQGAEKVEQKSVKYSKDFPYDTTDNLIARQLIKLVYSRIGAKGKEEPLKEITEEEIEALMAEEPDVIVEEPAEEPAEEEPEEVIEEPVKQPVKAVEVKQEPVDETDEGPHYMDKTKTGIINIDTLSRHFNAGEKVTLSKIKRRVPCFDQKVTYVKVLARGVIDKALTVEADCFSQEAIEKIESVGGKVIFTLR